MKNHVFLSFVLVFSSLVVGCAGESKSVKSPTDAPKASSVTCIGDQCSGGAPAATAVSGPQPVATAIAPSPQPSSVFMIEVEGVRRTLVNGEILSVDQTRMTPLYNLSAASDCSDTQVENLVLKPGPVCLVHAAPHELGMKKGESRPARWRVGSSEVTFTVKAM